MTTTLAPPAEQAPGSSTPRPSRACDQCGRPLPRGRRRFCTDECAAASRRTARPATGIRMRRYGRGHGYTVDGIKFPGVTTISSQIKGAGLINYTGKQVAKGAVNNWDYLATLPPADRLDALNEYAWAERDEAANRGTEVHRLGAEIAQGHTVEVPDELRGYVDAYIRWLEDWDPGIVAAELLVANRSARYCGLLDLIADIGPARPYGTSAWMPPGRHLTDVKTSRSGIWPETALQCCGYRWAEVYVHPESGNEVEMSALGVEYTSALWLTSDGGYEFRTVESGPEVWAQFRRLAAVWWGALDAETWVGATIEPAGPIAAPVP